MLKEFAGGFTYVLRGKRAAKKIPGVGIWILIPFLIDIIILWAGVYFGATFIQATAAGAVLWLFGGAESAWAQLIYYPLFVLLLLGFVGLFVYGVYLIASVIASPFYSILAEKSLVHFGVIQDRPFSLKYTLSQSLSMFIVSLKRAFILVLIGIVLFFCSFIPVLNIFAVYIAFVLLAMDSADFALEARSFSVSERIQYFRENFKQFMGMGAFLGLTLLIPGLILLIMPYAVVGAASLMAVGKIEGADDTKQIT